MFCPKCSHQQATDHVRYCSRCGFQLDIVKELLTNEGTGEPPVSLKDSKRSRLKQGDILIGAGFMLIGAIKAFLLTASVEGRGPLDFKYGLYMLGFGLGFALFLLFAQLSHRQRGLTLGATLMFAGSLVAFAALEFFGLSGVFLVALFLFSIIIFWTRLARIFMKTFFDRDEVADKVEQAPQISLMPPADSIKVDRPERMKTADLAEPPSITEETTTLLEKS